MNNNRLSFPNGFEKTEVRWGKIKIKLAPNEWCYVPFGITKHRTIKL